MTHARSNAPSMPGRMPHSMPQRCPGAMHATYATQLTRRIQDKGENSQLPYAADPGDNSDSDTAFALFLATIIPADLSDWEFRLFNYHQLLGSRA